MTGTRFDQPRVGAWRDARRQTLSVGLVSLVRAAVLLPSPGSAQWGRRGALVGREGYGGGVAERYGAPGGGYGYQAGPAPAYGGYPPAGYAAPPPGYGPSGSTTWCGRTTRPNGSFGSRSSSCFRVCR